MVVIAVGIDNGVSGGVGIITPDKYNLFKMPVFEDLNYQKSEDKYIHRIDVFELVNQLKTLMDKYPSEDIKVMIERPMINPHMFMASVSSARSLEAVLIALSFSRNEQFPNGLPKHYIDSKAWQTVLLPNISKPKIGKEVEAKERAKLNKEHTKRLKEAAFFRVKQMFPNVIDKIKTNADADSMLIAEYCRIYYNNQ